MVWVETPLLSSCPPSPGSFVPANIHSKRGRGPEIEKEGKRKRKGGGGGGGRRTISVFAKNSCRRWKGWGEEGWEEGAVSSQCHFIPETFLETPSLPPLPARSVSGNAGQRKYKNRQYFPFTETVKEDVNCICVSCSG